MKRLAGVATILIALAACSNYADAPQAVPLSQLAARPAAFDGQLVTTAGVLRSYPEPRHYWIEDEALHRVALRPDDAVADRVGETIRVVGIFHFSPDRGRWIRLEKVTAGP